VLRSIGKGIGRVWPALIDRALVLRKSAVQGDGIDQLAIELAEFGRLLRDRKFVVPDSKNPFGWDIEAPKGSGADPGEFLVEARNRLLAFKGRTKIFGVRPYISLDDYMAWSDRKVKEAPRIEEGLLCSSLLNWSKVNLVHGPDATEKPLKGSAKPTPQPADVCAQTVMESLAEGLKTLVREIRSATELHRTCSEQHFQANEVLFHDFADVLHSTSEDVDNIICAFNDMLLYEDLSGAPIDLDETAQSAQEEAKRQLELLVKRAKRIAWKRIEPDCNWLRQVTEGRKKRRGRRPNASTFP
jgi:hypothetical protein